MSDKINFFASLLEVLFLRQKCPAKDAKNAKTELRKISLVIRELILGQLSSVVYVTRSILQSVFFIGLNGKYLNCR